MNIALQISRSLVKKKAIEIAIYLATGVLNTAFGYAVYVLALWLGLNYIVAALISQVLGAVFNYVTYGRLVFRKKPQMKSLFRFGLQYSLTYLLNIFFLWTFQSLGLNAYLAGLVSTFVIAILTFFSNKFFVFATDREAKHE